MTDPTTKPGKHIYSILTKLLILAPVVGIIAFICHEPKLFGKILGFAVGIGWVVAQFFSGGKVKKTESFTRTIKRG